MKPKQRMGRKVFLLKGMKDVRKSMQGDKNLYVLMAPGKIVLPLISFLSSPVRGKYLTTTIFFVWDCFFFFDGLFCKTLCVLSFLLGASGPGLSHCAFVSVGEACV